MLLPITITPNVRFFNHVFNRGVDKRQIFLNDNHRLRFILTLRLSRLSKSPSPSVLNRLIANDKVDIKLINKIEKEFGPPFIDIIACVLMGNHFHLLTGEYEESRRSLAKFMQRVGTAFTMYFDKAEKRKGRLFESKYKSVDIIHDDQLIHTVRYIHVNPSNSKRFGLSESQLLKYRWSSLPSYISKPEPWINTEPVISLFKDRNDFWDFTKAGISRPTDELLEKDLRLE